MQDLSERDARVARTIAGRIARAGHRPWLVGGVVRDLAIGRETHDVDMASAATPEEIEAEFERTVPIGRAFGTVLIHIEGVDVEHTTFRSESGYSDARRPDAVTFGRSPEEDATRRDFTCNALYLDPLDGTVLDPAGGLSDLEAGRLACVGDPNLRFREDGLRIVRMARFAGQIGLQPTPATLTAAAEELDALRGISPERVRVELERLFERGGIVPALRLLASTGALERILPGLLDGSAGGDVEAKLALFAALSDPPGMKLGFAALFDPERPPLERALADLESLRPSRAVRDHVADVWRLAAEIGAADRPTRATRVRWMRRPAFEDALALCRGRARGGATEAGAVGIQALDNLARELASLRTSGLGVAPLLTAADIVARGIAPGPLFGAILREAETLQLDLELTTREAALRWLDARAQDGGNTRRNA